MNVNWGFSTWLYLWLAGMAAGAYFAAFLAERLGKHGDNRLLHTSLYIGIPAAMAGVILLLTDLSYPLRFWHLFVFFNITSPMSIGSWLLVIWMGLSILIVFLWFARNRIPFKKAILKRITGYLQWACFFASIFLMSYTGVLLAASNQPLWASTILLEPLFVSSAISTGVAILILVGLITRLDRVYGEILKRMVQINTVVIGIELVVLFIFIYLLSRSGIPGASESMRQFTTGTLAIPFWYGVVFFGILIPFALSFVHWGKKTIEHNIVFVASIASTLCVLFGGLILRSVIVISGQI